MYNPPDIIEILAGNIARTHNPFGIPKLILNRWHRGLNLPHAGDAMLFTGLMYQFSPFIEKSTHYLAQFEDSKWAPYARYARLMPSVLSGLGLAMLTPWRAQRKYNAILGDITRLLTASKVNFYYRPELDFYSGVLLYDLGDQESFIAHARYVARQLQNAGIRKLITVDPHTTYVMKILLPKYIGVQFEVFTYFELLALSSANGQKQRRVTLHDPCFYGRYLTLSDSPRKVLSTLGVECAPVRNSGRLTNCCGGPAESISPKLCHEVVGRRMAELNLNKTTIVAMCPICLGNLERAGARVEDLATVLAGQL